MAQALVQKVRSIAKSKAVLGDTVVDRSALDGEFAEFFLRPLADSPRHLDAGMRLLKSFDMDDVKVLDDLHARIDVPVQLVWGVEDAFFPIAEARTMVHTFPNAQLTELPGVGLLSQEEAPEAVATALLPVLTA